MKSKIMKTLAVAVVFGFAMNGILFSTAVNAAPQNQQSTGMKAEDACSLLEVDSLAYKSAGCDNTITDRLPTVVQNVLNVVIGMAGTVALVFIVMGGVQYMTSSGDPAKVKKAKDTILYACVGLVVCALSFAIVNWTISALESANKKTDEASEEEDASGGGGNSNTGPQQDSFIDP